VGTLSYVISFPPFVVQNQPIELQSIFPFFHLIIKAKITLMMKIIEAPTLTQDDHF